MAYFTFNTISSKSKGLRILNSFHHLTAKKSYEFITIDGRDGDLTIDNNRLEPMVINFPVKIYRNDDIDKTVKEIAEWLYKPQGYTRLEFTGISGYYYEALFIGQLNVLEELRKRGSSVISFKIKPLKRSFSGDIKIEITNGQTILNTEILSSKPILYLTGLGANININIGSEELKLKDIDGNMMIDCERGIALKDNKIPQYHKLLSYPFPVIKPGEQKIIWTGNITKFELIPRWVSY